MNKKRILAVDDDATALGALRQMLTQRGYDVTLAANGEEALQRIEEQTPDLIILDVAMPGLSGFETCRLIREAPRTRRTPIIFLTAKGLLTDMAEGQEAGSDLYLIKPVLATKLIATVGMFLAPDVAAHRASPQAVKG